MGKIVASYLVKVHVRAPDNDPEDLTAGEIEGALSNDAVSKAVIEALGEEFGGEVSVSLIERTED
jgi:hypothetical protein